MDSFKVTGDGFGAGQFYTIPDTMHRCFRTPYTKKASVWVETYGTRNDRPIRTGELDKAAIGSVRNVIYHLRENRPTRLEGISWLTRRSLVHVVEQQRIRCWLWGLSGLLCSGLAWHEAFTTTCEISRESSRHSGAEQLSAFCRACLHCPCGSRYAMTRLSVQNDLGYSRVFFATTRHSCADVDIIPFEQGTRVCHSRASRTIGWK